MKRFKIDYGIDLGTTNSAIQRMDNDKVTVIKSDRYQKDTTPSCVHFTKKGRILVGDPAFGRMINDLDNSFIEFKRTMGQDTEYHSSIMNKSYTSEELSAEVLKALKSYVKDEDFNSVVITVPADFDDVQCDATKKAAELAGFDYCELLQEPIAASTAYAIDSKFSDGYWLVFDFGGGTFDAVLMSSNEGIMKVVDIEGDNHLGGKNLDLLIVDEIIIPYFKKNHSIEEILNSNRRKEFRLYYKIIAEVGKIELSNENSCDLTQDPRSYKDDDGNELDLDLKINRSEYEKLIEPFVQKAIDMCKILLDRNHVKSSELTTILMVGGTTFTPLIKEMVKEQISSKINISIDPMIVVARGAAIFASTKNIPEELQNRDKSKVQLKIAYEETTTETEVNLGLKIDRNKTDHALSEKIFVELKRHDGTGTGGRIEIEDDATIIELQLLEGVANNFTIELFDEKGTRLDCEPSTFSVIQGTTIAKPIIPHDIGIATDIIESGEVKTLLQTVIKRKTTLPAKGRLDNLKTQKDIKPGNINDKIEIEVYEGDGNTNPLYNKRRAIFFITGEEISQFLPAGSEVNVQLIQDESRGMKLFADIPYLDESFEFTISNNTITPHNYKELNKIIDETENQVENIKEKSSGIYKIDYSEFDRLYKELEDIRIINERGKGDDDNSVNVKKLINKLQKKLDTIKYATEWDIIKNDLENILTHVIQNNEKWGNDKTTIELNRIESQIEEVKERKDIKIGKKLIDELIGLSQRILSTQPGWWISLILETDKHFDTISWKSGMENQAKKVLGKAKSIIATGYSDEVRECMFQLWDMMVEGQRATKDISDRLMID